MKKKVTPEVQKEIINLYSQGLIIREIANILKISMSTVQKYTMNCDYKNHKGNKINSPSKKQKVTQQMRIEFTDLYLKTKRNFQDIADIYGLAPSTVNLNTKHKPPLFTQTQLIELNKLYDLGTTTRGLEDIYKVNHATISSYIWKPRPKGSRKGSIYITKAVEYEY
ncbi:helix-turn-helix domain-containing protein [Clostridium sp.]